MQTRKTISKISSRQFISQEEIERQDDLLPIDNGPFGGIYDVFKGKPKEAFWFLIDHQDGDLKGVYTRLDLGEIDLVWGDHKCGLCHIMLNHINNKDFPTVNQMITTISDVVLNGVSTRKNPDMMVLKKNGYIVVIRRNYRIDGKKPESKNWILTAYSKEPSDATRAPLDTD